MSDSWMSNEGFFIARKLIGSNERMIYDDVTDNISCEDKLWEKDPLRNLIHLYK